MIWNADLAIVYACALTLTSALLLWALPTLFFVLVEAVTRFTRARLPAAPKAPAPQPSRIQALSARFPHLMR